MDLNKTQLLLDKINRLYKSMSLDPENVAPIEKDLMKDYIKLLYGAFLEDVPVHSSINNQPTIAEQKIVDRSDFDRAPPKVAKTTNTIRPQATRTITPSIPAAAETPRAQVISPSIAPPLKEEVTVNVPATNPTQPPRASVPPSRPPIADEVEEQLFMLENGTDLSHKLGSLPISDLHKAMGINERIFTINELFRGDARAFRHTINELNQLSSFVEAKAYLAKHIVNQFDWTNKQRRNKAKNFIKLVRRRYL